MPRWRSRARELVSLIGILLAVGVAFALGVLAGAGVGPAAILDAAGR